ncbi:hypothetical protein BK120_25115 [Paenibacillus sp. FSL A5-0031]|uniref:NAD(P)-binding domain-containing protein n=1 Tax=Paenibacillus sp. FSL A5-0031 TaxID=1920420 RepID=UPI00096EC812|nr:NAD(P)-binding domain-containing protein [Paenibacillus sp. FSL A5-0031]OME77979.1 hypothetical protein BK120_25115 [Paenibacillus sp. FSL A5-0031]
MSDLHNHNANEKQRTVAIVGLGYVGLPLALLFVRKGFYVVGVDLDRRKVESIQSGKSYINEINDQDIEEVNLSARFTVSNEFHLMDAAEAIVICVPTPLTMHGTPDLSYLTQAAKQISSRLKQQQLVILESSTYPGTTREVLLPVLNQSGLNAGIDYHIAYSPERVDPGNKHFDVESIPKVISGVTPGCLELNAETLSNTDCVIIATDHTSLPLQLVLEHAPFVYDTRNVVKGITGKSRIVTLGGVGS